MEYQKIRNLLDDKKNQLCKFRTINWVEINDDPRGAYQEDDDNDSNDDDDNNNNIKLKTSMIKSSLCNDRDACILVKETIAVPNTVGDAIVNTTNKTVMFKNCAPFNSCITKINNTQVDNA